ncbi:uncharacterized protein Tco025E_10105, partial [Trypanosoma conorhini]
TSAGDTKQLAFTMKCTTEEGSVLHNRSKDATDNSTATDPLGAPGVCEFQPPTPGGAEETPERQTQEQPPTGQEAGRTLEAPAAPSTPSVADRAADRPGGTQTPSTPRGRSGTPNAAPSAGGSDATTTTAATTPSPSAGSHAKSNADSSAINTLLVRAPLMLLLTAALACAAA